MDENQKKLSHDAPGDDPRVFFAAERTFLAWIRTGIALMGFGFILARFGIFLRQFQWMRENLNGRQFGASIWLGVTLVAIGVAVMIAAAARHVQIVRSLREGKPDFNRPSRLGIAVAITLACIGLITAIYLVAVSKSVISTSP
jgi:putative membrane protein